jgi:hypothetical protein
MAERKRKEIEFSYRTNTFRGVPALKRRKLERNHHGINNSDVLVTLPVSQSSSHVKKEILHVEATAALMNQVALLE